MEKEREDLPKVTIEDEELPVFDRGQEDLPWPPDAALPADDEGNILPGNDPLDEDPNDNGSEEQFDPEDRRNSPLPASNPKMPPDM